MTTDKTRSCPIRISIINVLKQRHANRFYLTYFGLFFVFRVNRFRKTRRFENAPLPECIR